MKFTYECTHSFDGENDVELSILFEYTPPAPARGPTYSCAGEPAEYTEVDVLGVMVNDRAATSDQFDQVIENERLYEEMEIHGAEMRREQNEKNT
jgi:hypothetical protein